MLPLSSTMLGEAFGVNKCVSLAVKNPADAKKTGEATAALLNSESSALQAERAASSVLLSRFVEDILALPRVGL
jgi:hypothetical protein